MNPGQKHSTATRKMISENTKKAMKDLSPNKTAFKPGHQPWNTGKKGLTGSNSGSFKPGHQPLNWQPPGTIVTKRVGNWTGEYIKLESGKWERYFPNGKPEKKIVEKVATPKQTKIFHCEICGTPGESKTSNKYCSDVCKLEKKKNYNKKYSHKTKPNYQPRPILQETPIKKTKEQLAIEKRDQQQRDFLASFGITGSVISIPINRGIGR